MPYLQISAPSRDSRPARAARSIKESRFLNYIYRALRAAAYPLQGIWYFLCHRDYWPLFLGRLLPLSIISFIVYFVLFAFAFLPQYAFLAIFHGWGAWVNAVFLTLGEGLIIIQGLFEGFFVDECRVDLFDAILIDHSLTDLVAPQRLLFLDAPNSVKMLGKPTSRAEYQPWSFVQIVELIVWLPLNLIPGFGVPAYLIITGSRLGKLSHYRWYKLRGLNRHERKEEIRRRVWDYTWFGTVAMILELVPILSFFFLLTSTAGSALWVAKMEKEMRGEIPESRAEGGQAGHSAAAESEAVHQNALIDDDELPPPYTDNPV